MEITRLIEELGRPEAYPHAADDLEIHQTHISVVFLAGPYAYKIKKPVDLEFLDFTTLQRRRHFCREEVRLNRPLAPGVYLGVVPITEEPHGLRVAGKGPTVEYAVMMERLPARATLLEALRRGELNKRTITELARRIAAFHARARGGPEVAACARWAPIAANARENFAQSRGHVGITLSEAVYSRLYALTEGYLERLRPLMERRALGGVPRDTHGDLHLEHVYWFPERRPPRDFLVLDCIEFNERFRYADPVSDMAFLTMDLAYRGRRDLARRFAAAYFEATGDGEGRELLSFYVAYRAAVRGKVEGMTAAEEEVPVDTRAAAVESARAHWLLALGELEAPARRPCLVLIAGLPGTGKSSVAQRLAERAGFRIVSSDEARKALVGLAPEARAPAAFGEGIYSREWSERTYRACLERAMWHLFRGDRVLVDASFREDVQRRAFLDAARDRCVPALILLCIAPPEVVRGRLAERSPGASDADWSVYERMAEIWEEPSPGTRWAFREVSTVHGAERAVEAALQHLRDVGLWR